MCEVSTKNTGANSIKSKVLLLTLFVLLLVPQKKTNAQIAEYYFNDIEQKEGGKINDHVKGEDFIIIGGRSFDSFKYMPAITKVDTLGQAVWSTTTLDQTVYSSNNVFIHRLMLSDTFLYATCIIEQGYNHPKEVWKIDATNGNIIWKKSFQAYNNRYPEHIIDYDSTKILIGYSDYYTGSVYKIRMAFVDKITGDTLSTHRIGDISWTKDKYGLAVDSQKNIYYTKHDSIFKVHYSNPDSVIWKARHISADVLDFQQIYIDSNDSIFLFGRKDATYKSGKAINISKNDGTLNWDVTASTGDVTFRDMVDKNGYIYTTWRHTLVGGGTYSFWTSKINKNSGNVEFGSSYNFAGLGTLDTHSGSGTGAMSIDVDNNGDVFLTGYYGDANYGPECWGILKLNSNTGNVIYEVTITEDSTKYDNISIGMVACVINNQPYFLGELQTHHPNGYERSKTTFIKLDGDSGTIILKKHIDGNYQFPSKTLYIENYLLSQTVVLKQTGRMIKLEMYDFNKNVLWEKTFTKNYFLFGGNLSVAPNGEIVLSAYSKSESSTLPYYGTNTDSIYLFHLDSGGNIIKEYGFYIGIDNAFPIELYTDSLSTLLFYQKNDNIYYRKFEFSTLSSEYDSQINYYDVDSRTKYCFNASTIKALLFGYKSGATRFIELDKNSMNTTNLATIPSPLNTINYTLEIDTNLVVLCGKNNSNLESIGLYNTSIKDTVWTKILSINYSQALKCVIDDQKEFIYLVSNNENNVIIRKLAVSDGTQSWEYTFNGTANLYDSPTDITYDNQKGKVVVSAFETDSSNNKRVLILVLDSSGTVLDTIQKAGDFTGDNYALCSAVLPDGSMWIGGNLNKNLYGLAGFIFEIDLSIIPTAINFVHPYELGISVFPNPFSAMATLNTNKLLKNARLILYNSNGTIVKEIEINEQTAILRRDKLPAGLYFIQLMDNNNFIKTEKIIIID